MRSVKVWLDDCRAAPEGWTHVITVPDAIQLLQDPEVVVEAMSLDHDLGCLPPCRKCASCEEDCSCGCHKLLQPTGYDLVKWMAAHERWPIQKPTCHSANPVGRRNILAVVDRYWTFPSP